MWFLTGRRLEERLHTPNTSVSHLLRLFGTSRGVNFTALELGRSSPWAVFVRKLLSQGVSSPFDESATCVTVHYTTG